MATQTTVLAATLSVVILPPDDDLAALEANQNWRLLWIAPIVSMIIFLSCMVCYIRDEAPRFYLYTKGNKCSARRAIHNIYET